MKLHFHIDIRYRLKFSLIEIFMRVKIKEDTFSKYIVNIFTRIEDVYQYKKMPEPENHYLL